MSPDPNKAAHYLQLLEEARCDGNWEAVPEWVRKVRKHAPARTCLTLTAEAEHAVATTAQHQPAPWRPSTANSSTYLALSRYIQLLIEAIDQEQKYPEDAFQAKICLSWIHWQLGEAALGAQRVPRNIEEEYQRISASNKGCQDYTKADVLKAAYIKGSYLAKADAIGEAMDTFNSVLPIFTNISSTLMNKKEIHTWAELYLTEFCLTSSKALKSKPSSIIDAETLSAFRAWATFWEEQKSGPIGGRLPQANVSRRLVWLEYYHIVSQFLQQNLPYSTTALIATHPDIATRQKQKAELIRVESKYEALLLSEVQFPEAEAVNDEVEAFVKLVMQNWHILCSDSWQDPDKSQGDAETISRAVLDILYRAAKKTFHSTHILRHLVTVHLFIGEFDLAFKAFDTYLDLVKKGKERIKKTGEPEPGLDNDEEILKTASECMRALCKYGPEDGAEKAHQLAIYFEEWLDKDGTAEKSEDQKLPLDSVSPNVLARTWSSVGMAHAQWSRAAFDATARANIQLRAIACFRKALRPEYGSTTNVETLFALGTLLAERRELTAAIEVVKAGLLAPSQTKSAKSQEKRFLKERSLIPLWHLLALLVSARQEFVTAARSCEGAFEQFIEPSNLFGDADLNTSHASNHQNTNEKSSLRSFGIVDEMDDFEKGNVLEVKMTQLALVEVLEGPEIAVNASGELLSLYGRLFGSDPEKNNPLFVVPKTATSVPPHSATGTLKSKTGSVFNRPLSVRNPQRESTLGEKTTQPPRPDTTQTATAPHAPAIQITGENGNLPERRKPSHEKLRKRSGSLQRKDSEAGRERSKSQSSSRNPSRAPSVRDQPTTATQHAPTTVDGEKFTTPPETPGQELMGNMNTLSKHVHNLSLQENTSFGETQKGLSSSMTSHKLQGPSLLNDLRVKLPRIQQGHRRVGTLIKVWLLIAGFYRRALMYDDARGAVEEAQKLVERLETGMLRDVSRNITIDHAGWGGGKSVNELWGDVYAERGYLAIAEGSPIIALQNFESALIRFVDHPAAIVGLSNILLDVYGDDSSRGESIPSIALPAARDTSNSTTNGSGMTSIATLQDHDNNMLAIVSQGPLGLPIAGSKGLVNVNRPTTSSSRPSTASLDHPETGASNSPLDRFAARDRAYALLTGLTKLGTGWNYSEAWYSLARAYEESGQLEKAKEVLWWCVELEDTRAVRDWRCAAVGGYVL